MYLCLSHITYSKLSQLLPDVNKLYFNVISFGINEIIAPQLYFFQKIGAPKILRTSHFSGNLEELYGLDFFYTVMIGLDVSCF